VNELKETVPIPNIPDDPFTPVLTCYVACADAQYVLDSGEVWHNTQDPVAALAAGIAKGYDPQTGPGATGKTGACDTMDPKYNTWDYVTHCHIL
jgi:hypothetical protein